MGSALERGEALRGLPGGGEDSEDGVASVEAGAGVGDIAEIRQVERVAGGRAGDLALGEVACGRSEDDLLSDDAMTMPRERFSNRGRGRVIGSDRAAVGSEQGAAER